MEPDFNSVTVPPMQSVEEQLLLPPIPMVGNAQESIIQQQIQPAELNIEQSSMLNFDNSTVAASVSNETTPQLTSQLNETDNPLGRFFEENPGLEVLNAEYVPTSEILQDGQGHLADTEDQNANEDTEGQQDMEEELARDEDAADDEDAAEDDLEEEAEEEDAEAEDEEEADVEEVNEEAIIPDDNVANVKSPQEILDIRDNNDEQSHDDKDETSQTQDNQSDSEQPASSSRVSRTKEEEVDENQCRVCCAKEDLVTLFKKIEERTVADMLMIICPSVFIAIKDFLPQFICNSCMENVVKAIQLKEQCETTEKELRKKLSRHKNKIRRPVGYVVIDAPLDSDPASEDEPNNDEEFKVSDIASTTPSEDSESSDLSDSKKKKTKSRKRRKSAVTTPTFKNKMKNIKSEYLSSGGEDDGDPIGNHKRKRSSNSSPETYACEECDHIFIRKQSLILHMKAHSNDREPIACKVCGRKFKIRSAYRTHMQKHRDDKSPFKCQKCSRSFSSNGDLKHHLAEDHNLPGVLFECSKCSGKFVSSSRLESHKKHGRCPGSKRNKKSNIETFVVGKDLFKTVAPLTTTYWSDSFSD